MQPARPGDLALHEAALLALALSAALVLAQTAGLVLAIPTFGALARGTRVLLRVWLDVAAVAVPLGVAAAFAARALPAGEGRRSAAIAAVVLASAAAGLLHAASLGGMPLRNAHAAGTLGPAAVALAALLLLVAVAWRARPTLRSVAIAGLVAAAIGLGTALQWATLVRGYTGLAPDLRVLALASGIAALPLFPALWRARRAPAGAAFAASLAAYAGLGAIGLAVLPAPAEETFARRLSSGAEVPRRPPLVLIVADTLRADFVTHLGGPPQTTPHLDALARDGVVFERARSTSPWTIPAFASLLTSTYPSEHGAGERAGPRLRRMPLAPRLPTLAEALEQAGYATAAVVSNAFLGRPYGLARGFDSYQNLQPTRLYYPIPAWLHDVFLPRLRPGQTRAYVRGDRETQRVRDRLEALREGERPWALLAHYMDTHRPYQAKRFGWRARTETESYRAAVAFLDEQVGALLDALREAGAYDEALVVFTADHGEELTEDRLPGDYDHGHTLHRELLRVPLIVKLPGGRRAGERRSDDASLIDVAPSVLGVLGVAAPHSFRGIDLLADGAAERAAERTLIAESLLHVPEQKAAIRAGYKVMLRSLPPRREAAEAFDLSHDANELHPLPVTGDPRFEPLYHAIEAHVAAAPPGRRRAGAPALDPQLRRDLEALGYAR